MDDEMGWLILQITFSGNFKAGIRQQKNTELQSVEIDQNCPGTKYGFANLNFSIYVPPASMIFNCIFFWIDSFLNRNLKMNVCRRGCVIIFIIMIILYPP